MSNRNLLSCIHFKPFSLSTWLLRELSSTKSQFKLIDAVEKRAIQLNFNILSHLPLHE